MIDIDVPFRVDSKMARLLGQQSVSNNVAAIFELVKNGYDADSNLVEVVFLGNIENKRLRITKIKIRDDGNGMTLEDIINKWMVVGTDSKEREMFSPRYKRRVVGEKGIGRFATQRLGSKVTIVSEPRDIEGRITEYPNKRVTLQLDWTKYQPGTTFDQIKHKVKVLEKPSKLSFGTELIIEDLNDIWTQEQIDRLRDKLSSLVIPKELQDKETPPFTAKIIAEGFQLPDMRIESRFFSKAPYEVKAKLRSGAITYVIIDRENENDVEIKGEPITGHDLKCGNADFHLYHFPQDKRNSSQKRWENYYRHNMAMNANVFAETLRDHCGVRIYNDNVRVLPYGEPGNDWLDLNTRQLGKFGGKEGKISNKSVIGFLLLTRAENKDVVETTTREGLIKNRAYSDLEKFVKLVIDEFEAYKGKKWLEQQEKEGKKDHMAETKTELKGIQDALLEVKEVVADLPLEKRVPYVEKQVSYLSEKLSHVDKKLETIDVEHKEEIEEYVNTEEIYRNLSSIGVTTISFAHEIVNPLVSMDLKLSNLLRDLGTPTLSNEDRKEKLLFLSNSISSMLHWANYIRAFSSLIAGTGEQKKKEFVNLKTNISQILKAYAGALTDNNIDVRPSIPDYVPNLYMNRADLESVIVNLLTNSVKSLKLVERKRIIQISVESTASHLRILFSDNGIGIKKSDYERIFQPLYTTYNDPDRGIMGTGMGLTIIRDILNSYEGTISVSKPEFEPGASFLVSLPLNRVTKIDGQEDN